MALTSKITPTMRKSKHSRKRIFQSQEMLRQSRKVERQNRKDGRNG